MAEINRKDFIPDEVIKAPLEAAENVDHLIDKLGATIKVGKEMGKVLHEATSTTELKKLIDTLTVEQEELKKVNGHLQSQLDIVKKSEAEHSKFSSSIGNASGSLQKLAPGLHSSASGFMAMTKAALIFLATPIGIVIAALGAALFALTSYFKGSEEGQNKLNKVVQIGKAIFEQFMNVVEFVGKLLVEAFENPQAALEKFGEMLKQNLINRFVGFLELLPALGKAVSLLFKGEFAAAGEVAFNAVAKVVAGVENATSVIGGLIDETKRLVDAGIEAGNRIANLQAAHDLLERDLIVRRAETQLKVSKLREEAVKVDGEAKRKFIVEAIRLERELSDAEVKSALIALAISKETLKAHGDDKEALDNVAKATAAVANARASAFQNTLRFQKELANLTKADNSGRSDQIAQMVAVEVKASEDLFNKKKADAERTKGLGQSVLKFRKKMADDAAKYEEEKEKNSLENRIKAQIEHLDRIAGIYQHFTDVIGSSLDMLTDNRLAKIDAEEERAEESYNRELEMAGDNAARKTELENAFAAKKDELERKKRDATRKSAIFERAVNITMAIINTAKAVVALLATPPLAIAAGIAGAAQIAIMIGSKIPAYFRGTKDHKGGLAKVGEYGPELLLEPDEPPRLSPGVSTIMNLKPHTQVVPYNVLAKSGLLVSNRHGGNGPNILNRYFERLENTIRNKRETHYNWTRRGLEKAFQNGESRNYFMDEFYK